MWKLFSLELGVTRKLGPFRGRSNWAQYIWKEFSKEGDWWIFLGQGGVRAQAGPGPSSAPAPSFIWEKNVNLRRHHAWLTSSAPHPLCYLTQVTFLPPLVALPPELSLLDPFSPSRACVLSWVKILAILLSFIPRDLNWVVVILFLQVLHWKQTRYSRALMPPPTSWLRISVDCFIIIISRTN
jgi:hypothetical protein